MRNWNITITFFLDSTVRICFSFGKHMKYRDVLYKWNYASVMTDQQKWSKVSLMARLDMGWSLVDVDSDLVGTWPAPKDRVNWDPGPMAKLETHIWKYRWTPFCDHTWYANDIAYIYIFSHTHIYIYIHTHRGPPKLLLRNTARLWFPKELLFKTKVSRA
jgi:hypothetical protein